MDRLKPVFHALVGPELLPAPEGQYVRYQDALDAIQQETTRADSLQAAIAAHKESRTPSASKPCVLRSDVWSDRLYETAEEHQRKDVAASI